MQPIHPICEDTLRDYIGKPICAVLHDGSYFYGTVSAIRDGKLYFGSGIPGDGTVSTRRSAAKRQLAAKRRKKAAPVLKLRCPLSSPVMAIRALGMGHLRWIWL
ncbi:hypothetical protein DUZ99_04740 [Xylanibacillus composti]|uniref:Uncharacterized protein n=1 Tax=Xylanibacillus composti TaxID=1572762 RepID=A0A8J4M2U3_9BACL|nr:hypothetical protein [Xylanibacillus composti]MDT9724296.1 hypothetical protein [Xylanibacillus composti]GIQ69292.1 hypothetical protein XYCOK13_21160 [Xylanibacillus composti]